MANDYKKPIPSPQGESDFYWEKAKQEELWLRECPVNGPYFYPRDISPGAMRKETKWINKKHLRRSKILEPRKAG